MRQALTDVPEEPALRDKEFRDARQYIKPQEFFFF